MSAPEAAEAFAAGWLEFAPDDDVVVAPVSDGGPGFCAALARAKNLDLTTTVVTGPLGAPVDAQWLLDGDTAFIEVAQACGLHLLTADSTNPEITTSRGVGELILAALAADVKHIVVGVGGTSTNDGGAGMLAALGATALNNDGEDATVLLSRGGYGLRDISVVNLNEPLRLLKGVSLEVATDVDNPFLGARGATNTFAPQKGATQEMVMRLETSMEVWATACGRRSDNKSPAVALGAGAGGGLGFGLIHLGAVRTSGIERILELTGIGELCAWADLVITGEGSFDWQSLRGKVVTGVAAAAMNAGTSCVVVAGEVSIGRREWLALGVHGAYSMSEVTSEDFSHNHAVEAARKTVRRAARTWHRPS